eukprot:3688520-Prymnesium_polylepis.2
MDNAACHNATACTLQTSRGSRRPACHGEVAHGEVAHAHGEVAHAHGEVAHAHGALCWASVAAAAFDPRRDSCRRRTARLARLISPQHSGQDLALPKHAA